jgi:hypothetical protein
MADPTKVLYLRAAILCFKIDNHPDGTTTLRGVVGGLRLPDSGQPIELPLMAHIAIERNDDRAAHSLVGRFVSPSGATMEGLAEAAIPPFEDAPVDTVACSMAVTLLTPARPEPGIYKLLLEIDRRLAGWVPLTLDLVDPKPLGNKSGERH